ncbi:MAG: PQQ-dependent sugar dehydrogenase, partial [Steroidobacteraceae bacterium]
FVLSHTTPSESRSAVLAVLAGALLLASLGFALRRFRAVAFVVLAAGVVAVSGLEAYRTYHPAKVSIEQVESDINTAFYTLHAVTYRNAVPYTIVHGGGISLIGAEYLLATGDGRLYVFRWHEPGHTFSIRQLPYRVPMNSREFAADANPSGYQGNPDSDIDPDQLQGVQTWQFRVADIRVMEDGERVRVFVSHHYWKRGAQCFVVRVSSMSGPRAAFLAGDPGLHWETVFESSPCVPLHGPGSLHENNPFAGMEIGGRLFPIDAHRLLLTLGDHDFSGLESKRIFAQDPHVSYGKTILLHLDDGSSEIFSMGHRNPQGLYITADGTIWSTEHGPQGGVELNLIVQGAN